MSSISKFTHRYESFSVGVKPQVNEMRRRVMDAIAILAGLRDRRQHHVQCFERMVFVLDEMRQTSPHDFLTLFAGDFLPDAQRKEDESVDQHAFRMITQVLYTLMVRHPGDFVQYFGGGNDWDEKRFAGFVKRLTETSFAEFVKRLREEG